MANESRVHYYTDSAGDQFRAFMDDAPGLGFGWNAENGMVFMASTCAGKVTLTPKQTRAIAAKLLELADKAEGK